MSGLSAPTDRFGAWGTASSPPSAGGYASNGPALGGPTDKNSGVIPNAGTAVTASGTGQPNNDPNTTKYGLALGGAQSSDVVGSGGNGTGAGIDGGGGSQSGAVGGTMYFDGGGMVPDDQDEDTAQAPDGNDGDSDDQQNPTGDSAGAPPTDPMSVIKQALLYGRQSMGLPENFTSGPSQQGQQMAANMPTKPGTQSESGVIPQPPTPGALGQPGQQQQTASFDDGGVVPDPAQQNQPSNQPGTGSQLPDPRKTLQYLSGASGVQPEIADAMEKLVDPQGTMDPAERTLATIMSSPSPNAQFGLMQHYRTRANAYSGAARAALDQGNLAQAAAHATAAYANTPTGYSVKFAPARGGVAMSARKVGQGGQSQGAQQQSFDAGGDVDMDNPANVMKQAGGSQMPGMDSGGVVPNAPQSENIEDRRGLVDANGNGMEGGTQATPKWPGWGKGGSGDISVDAKPKWMKDMPSYDDGGVVPDNMEGGDPGTDGTQSTATPSSGDPSLDQPIVLSPDQFKQAAAPGAVDQVADHPNGFMGFIQDTLAKAKQVGPALNRMLGGPGQQPADDTNGSTTTGTDPAVQAATQATQPQGGAAPSQGATAPITPPVGKGDRSQMAQTPPPPSRMQQMGGDEENALIQRLQAQAAKIYPGYLQSGNSPGGDHPGIRVYGGDQQNTEAQRRNYVEKSLEALRGSQGKIEENTALGSQKMALQENKEGHIDTRAANNVNERWNVAQLNNIRQAMTAGQNQIVRLATSELANGNSDPADVTKKLAQQLGINPENAQQLLMPQQQQSQGDQGNQGNQQQPQGGPGMVQQINKKTGETRWVQRTPQQGYHVDTVGQ